MTSIGQLQPHETVVLEEHDYEDVAKYQQKQADYEVITSDSMCSAKHRDPLPLPSQAMKTSLPSLESLSPPPPTSNPSLTSPYPLTPPPPTVPQSPPTSLPQSSLWSSTLPKPPSTSEPQPVSQSGDYGFTECIAYKPTSNTSTINTDTDVVYSNISSI